MEVVFVMLFALLIFVGFLALMTSEPASSAQKAEEVKRNIEREKEQGMAAIDAATAAYKREVYEVVVQANRRAIEEQAAQARWQAQQTVMNATREKQT